MKKYTLQQAIELLATKRGAGSAKHTKIKLEIEFDGGMDNTPSILITLKVMLIALSQKSSPTGFVKNFKVKEEVQTELEENEEATWMTGGK